MADPDPIEIAARALQHRDRSRREIEARLARAGIDDDRLTDALDTLERVGYVDDGRFAGARAEALANRGYGDEWIRHDLREHGVAGEAIAEAVGALVPEGERAAGLVERLGRTPKTAKQLARKGFGEDALETALGIDLGN
ncbi:MAG TPA: regulatory protein RecX [Gaiellaceae bacterium]|jgi:regulatory protein|nr:regulatory protein RecX [Gaiellaceae bacterium]